MRTVAVIGAGDLGGAVAQALASSERIGQVVLVDDAVRAAAGKALDIQQSGAVDGFHTRVTATDDLSAVIGAAACVIADRVGPPAAEWSGEQGLAMLGRLSAYAGDAPIVFAGSGQGELMRLAARELRVRRQQLVGSASEAFASAVRAIVALESGSAPDEVALSVLGAPGGFVVPWSDASIGGYALERVLGPVSIARIEARMARLWPPGPLTLGLAAARAATAVATSSRRRLSMLTVLGGEFGVKDRIGSLPVLLASRGITDARVPELNPRERVMVESALST